MYIYIDYCMSIDRAKDTEGMEGMSQKKRLDFYVIKRKQKFCGYEISKSSLLDGQVTKL